MRRDAWQAGHDSLPSSATDGTLTLFSKALPTDATEIERMSFVFQRLPSPASKNFHPFPTGRQNF